MIDSNSSVNKAGEHVLLKDISVVMWPAWLNAKGAQKAVMVLQLLYNNCSNSVNEVRTHDEYVTWAGEICILIFGQPWNFVGVLGPDKSCFTDKKWGDDDYEHYA